MPRDATPDDRIVVACHHVRVDAAPVREVRRDAQGDRTFTCGGPHETTTLDHVRLGDLLGADPTLRDVLRLEPEQSATRADVGGAWERHDDAQQRIRDEVEKRGWHVVAVPADDATGLPAYAYTVGLSKTFAHPECIVFGLGLETAVDVLRMCVIGVSGGRALVSDAKPQLLAGTHCIVRDVHPSRVHVLSRAIWLAGSRDFRVVQLSWPDRNLRYPWHSDCEAAVKAAQPQLTEPEGGG